MKPILLRSRRTAALAMVAAASLLTACGAGGASGDNTKGLVIDGTWVNDTDPTDRGGFVMTGSTNVSGASGTLSGTLQFYGADGSLLADEPVSGTLSGSLGASLSYWSIDFATGDGKLTFFTASYDGYDSSSQLLGQFTNAKTTTATQGRWHSNPPGGFSDCVIFKAFAQTGFTFQDLAWGGSRLTAVATPTGGALASTKSTSRGRLRSSSGRR